MAEAVSVLAQLKQRKPSPQIVATPKTALEQEVDEDLLLEGTLHHVKQIDNNHCFFLYVW